MVCRVSRWLLLVLFTFTLWGCSNSSEPAPIEAELAAEESGDLDHRHREMVVLPEGPQLASAFASGVANFEPDEPFRQVGFFFATWTEEPLDYRVRFTDGQWSDWRSVEVTWKNSELQVGRVMLDAEAVELEVREDPQLSWLQVEFFEEITARTDVLTRDLPFEEASERIDADGYTTVRQQALPNWVVTRSQWGARNPGKICGSAHSPYRQAIHHTVGPRYDGSNINRTMQGIQAYHIDTNRWCDIGYHFVVSQAGRVYQGRSRVGRTGAHVGGQNTGNVGTSLIGNYQADVPGSAQVDAAARIVGWVGRTFSIPFNRNRILGHREHRGQNTSCPGGNMMSRLDTLVNKAKNDGGGSPTNYDVDVSVNWVGAANFYTQGISHNLADALPGHDIEAEILVKNKSDDVIRNVWVGYLIQHPWLEATDYTIYTDVRTADGQSWRVNDSDSAEENPPKDQLGETGRLYLYAFAKGETKRILIKLKAKRYSIGVVDHPDVRGWLHHAEGRDVGTVFGNRDSWSDGVETNELGHGARGYAQLDVLDRNAWLFNDTTNEGNLEGWVGAPDGHFETLKNNNRNGTLAMKVTGDDARLLSPEWTRVPADRFDQLVLQARSHDGAHTKAIFWARDGESFSEERAVRFEAPGDGEFGDLVIPLGEHPEWSGTIKRLRIDPIDAEAPAEDDAGWYDLDGVFFQSSSDQATSGPGVEFSDASPVAVDIGDDGGANNGTNNGTNNATNNGTNNGTNNATNNGTGDGGTNNDTGGDTDGDAEATDDGGNVSVNEGCSAAGGGSGSPAGAVWLLLAGAMVCARRMRPRG